MGTLGGSVGGAGGKVGLRALGVSLSSSQAKHYEPADVAFQKEKDAVRELPYNAQGHCKLRDYRQRAVDYDGNFLRFHEGLYEMGKLKSRCLVNKWSPKNPVDFTGFSLLKNVRQHSLVTLENFYDESGQARIVISWVAGSLTAWLKQGGYNKCFQTVVALHGNCPSIAFRRMIIDTCRALEHLFSQDLYPSAIKESDLYLCNEKERGKGSLLKMLVCHADRLSSATDIKNRKCKLWADVKTTFQEICKHSDRMLTIAAEKFVDFIGEGNVDKLEAFPDIWCSEKKICYLFSLVAAGSTPSPCIFAGGKTVPRLYPSPEPYLSGSRLALGLPFSLVAADRSKMLPKLSKIKFAWPGKVIISELLNYENNKPSPTTYISDVYDYLRLCRNVIKHCKKFRANVNLLKISCPNPAAFLQKMEEWTPAIWCDLFKEVGWPEG